MRKNQLVGRNRSEIYFINNIKCVKKILIGEPVDILRRKNNLLKWESEKILDGMSPRLIDKNELNNEFTYEWIENSLTIQYIL